MSTIKRKEIEYTLIPLEGNTDYYVSRCGGLWNAKAGKRMKDGIHKGQKYVRDVLNLSHGSKIIFRHRLIALTFIPNPNNYTQVDHIDRDKLNNHCLNIRWVDNKTNLRNRSISKANKTGVTGVRLKINIKNGREVYYYAATWTDLTGRQFVKSFSLTKYGEKEAFRMACQYRSDKIEELNKQGAGYSSDHGL